MKKKKKENLSLYLLKIFYDKKISVMITIFGLITIINLVTACLLNKYVHVHGEEKNKIEYCR